MILITIVVFFSRVVADDQPLFGSGSATIFRVFGSISGLLLFGAVIDLACVEWEYYC